MPARASAQLASRLELWCGKIWVVLVMKLWILAGKLEVSFMVLQIIAWFISFLHCLLGRNSSGKNEFAWMISTLDKCRKWEIHAWIWKSPHENNNHAQLTSDMHELIFYCMRQHDPLSWTPVKAESAYSCVKIVYMQEYADSLHELHISRVRTCFQ